MEIAKSHLFSEHVELNCICPHCDFKCTSSLYLRRHIQSMHKVIRSEDLYECSECQVKFKLRMNLQKHKRYSCGQREKINCQLCSFKSKNKLCLRRHMLTDHKDAMDLQNYYECDKCRKIYKYYTTYKRHIEFQCGNKLPKKTFYCAHCDYFCTRRDKFTRHLEAKHIKIVGKLRNLKKMSK